jgi:hypothetical protein
MVLLKGRDDLGYLAGRLGAHFRSVTLTALHARFLAAAPETDKMKAAAVLEEFYRAAVRLRARETERGIDSAFNHQAAPSLMKHLRNPAQFSAMRTFSAAKENLLGFHPEIGHDIVRLVEHDVDGGVPAPARVSAPIPVL